jgi:hypothetical protein
MSQNTAHRCNALIHALRQRQLAVLYEAAPATLVATPALAMQARCMGRVTQQAGASS